MLNTEQVERYQRDGFLLDEVDAWVEESRSHDKPFGQPTIDGRPRFDMGAEHTAGHPALRRINNPSDISDAFADVMRMSAQVDMVADLVGPDVKFHHCKVNVKLPGGATVVDYHQDFAYTPHTNDDVVTALLLLDAMTPENGCLTVAPGSHRGPLYSLFDRDRFTGAVEAKAQEELRANEVSIAGPAGAVCLMHSRLAHGSEANRSDRRRGLYICVYSAADAVPIAPNPMPNPNAGTIVRGRKARRARLTEASIELPEQPKSAAFFTVQGQDSATGRN
jgi:hypothetical protein